ncbi:MAG: phage portal protein [Clostridia bacterium]|nr:phage portal protein [Clostridia bacterium]
MVFQLENPNVSPEVLQEQLERFLRQERPRRARLAEYYRGEQGVRKGPIAQGRPNNLLTANFAKYITDVHTGYFMGLPPTLTFERRRAQERVGRALEEAGLEGMLYAAARDMSVCGEGYLLTYVTAKGPRLARLDPMETFVLTAGIRQEPVAAVRVCVEKGDAASGEVHLPGEVRRWEMQGKVLTLGEAEPTLLDSLAVTRFRNNLDGVGDFEPVCSLLDAYNVLLSGAMDDMQSVANAFLALYGVMGTTQEDIDRANRSRVLCLSDTGKAEFVVKNLSPDTIALLRDTLKQDLLSITMTPDLQDAAFAGDQSGVALEYKLWGIEQARAAKEQGFAGGLYHIVGLFCQALELLGTPVACGCTARFYKNLPQDVTRICENLQLLGDTLSDRTKLELLPFVKDAQQELQRKLEEKGA